MEQSGPGNLPPEPRGPPPDAVAEQYEHWVYPARVYDLAALPLDSPDWRYGDLRALFWQYWPRAAYRDDLEILVAGCGSMAAACYAYLYPRCRVLGIDVSAASLEHEEFLKRKHNLGNLSVRRCRVEDAAALGARFDFISCYGVLHHLADPAAGLRALGSTLREDGVIDIMIYGKYGRVGVGMLQEMFRVMGLGQEPADVQAVKDALATLGPGHPVQRYLRLATDLDSDEGLVDTFLHRRDEPFSCGACLDLVHEAGLAFQGWKENGLYYPDAHVAPANPFRAHVERLGERRLWEAVELFDGNIALHWFHACRPERDPASYCVCVEDEGLPGYIPVLRPGLTLAADPSGRSAAVIVRPPFPPAPLDPWQAAVFSQIDSARSVWQCLETAGIRGGQTEMTAYARGFFGSLWRMGHVLFRLPET